jgi:hypothetical protein
MVSAQAPFSPSFSSLDPIIMDDDMDFLEFGREVVARANRSSKSPPAFSVDISSFVGSKKSIFFEATPRPKLPERSADSCCGLAG